MVSARVLVITLKWTWVQVCYCDSVQFVIVVHLLTFYIFIPLPAFGEILVSSLLVCLSVSHTSLFRSCFDTFHWKSICSFSYAWRSYLILVLVVKFFRIYAPLKFIWADMGHILLNHYSKTAFYTPVFRRDVLWYGDVRPGLRPTLRPPVFHTFLLHALTYLAEILHMTLF